MYDFHSCNLPDTFNTFFIPVNHTHNYNIRYSAAKLWNDIDDETKKLKQSQFKKKLNIYY